MIEAAKRAGPREVEAIYEPEQGPRATELLSLAVAVTILLPLIAFHEWLSRMFSPAQAPSGELPFATSVGATQTPRSKSGY
jgi:hypothetical protein